MSDTHGRPWFDLPMSLDHGRQSHGLTPPNEGKYPSRQALGATWSLLLHLLPCPICLLLHLPRQA